MKTKKKGKGNKAKHFDLRTGEAVKDLRGFAIQA